MGGLAGPQSRSGEFPHLSRDNLGVRRKIQNRATCRLARASLSEINFSNARSGALGDAFGRTINLVEAGGVGGIARRAPGPPIRERGGYVNWFGDSGVVCKSPDPPGVRCTVARARGGVGPTLGITAAKMSRGAPHPGYHRPRRGPGCGYHIDQARGLARGGNTLYPKIPVPEIGYR